MPADVDAALPAPWLAVRLGVDPIALDVRRRALELFAVHPPGAADWLYPGWQFDDDWRVKPAVARVLEEARNAGMTSSQLDELLQRRVGLSAGRRLGEALAEGDDVEVVNAIRNRP
jgi:hypothetical protein